MKAIIIEDEMNSREHLRGLIQTFCTNIALVGEASSVESAWELIKKQKPDLVFLDIIMPDGSGFDLLRKFKKIDFNVIFITAHAEYAIEAFQFSAIHYLLKPVDPNDLLAAVEKAEHENKLKTIESRVQVLLENMKNNDKPDRKLVLTTLANIFVINSNEVIMCSSFRNYTHFYLIDGREITVSKTIKEYHDMLIDHGFFRAHKQYLININHIRSFEKLNPGKIILTNGIAVPVSVRKKEQLIKLLSNI